MPLIAAACLLVVPPNVEPAEHRVDVIEVNHVYDGRGCHTLSQYILWDRGEVRAWCLTSRRTWTQHDRELAERQRLPVERRRGFR